MSAHEEHVQAVGLAGMSVTELQQLLSAAKEKAGETLGVILNAVGQTPSEQSGGEAMAIVTDIELMLEDMIGRCNAAVSNLNDFSRMFSPGFDFDQWRHLNQP